MILKYGLEKDGPSVILTKPVIETITLYRQLSKKDKEAGGQLFAIFEDYNTIIIEATEPKMFDKRSRYSFVPSRFIQKIEIKSRHKVMKHFVGDWHSHPEPIPTPSDLDLNSMADCFRKSRHELLSFVMIITGTAEPPKGLFVCLVNGDGVRKLKLQE
jgi:integrative and conjugative element protein (TIGR02256 family)